jgi:hypothetical protein
MKWEAGQLMHFSSAKTAFENPLRNLPIRAIIHHKWHGFVYALLLALWLMARVETSKVS